MKMKLDLIWNQIGSKFFNEKWLELKVFKIPKNQFQDQN